MTLREVLEEVHRLNLRLEVEGDNIRVTPSGQLPDLLREGLREHKAALLALLWAQKPKMAPVIEKPPLAPTASAPVAANPPPADPKPTPQAAPQAPEIICFKCMWEPPRTPNCPRCAWEREKARRYGTRSVMTACFNCRQLPPGPPGCPFCADNRRHAKLVGREHEGILTEYSDPQAMDEWVNRALGRNRG